MNVSYTVPSISTSPSSKTKKAFRALDFCFKEKYIPQMQKHYAILYGYMFNVNKRNFARPMLPLTNK